VSLYVKQSCWLKSEALCSMLSLSLGALGLVAFLWDSKLCRVSHLLSSGSPPRAGRAPTSAICSRIPAFRDLQLKGCAGPCSWKWKPRLTILCKSFSGISRASILKLKCWTASKGPVCVGKVCCFVLVFFKFNSE